MSDSARVQKWRDAKRQAGKKGVTLWLDDAEEARLKDAALTWHCSPSEMLGRAWGAFHPGQPSGIGNNTDTLQLRQLIREELAAMQETQTPVTVTSNGNVAETGGEEPAIVERAPLERVTVTSNGSVTDMRMSDTDTALSDTEGRQRPVRQDETAQVSDTEGTTGQTATKGAKPQPGLDRPHGDLTAQARTFAASRPSFTGPELTQHLGTTAHKANKPLRKMVDAGQVRQEGTRRTAVYRWVG